MADIQIPLDEMTVEEKLQAMETLWIDLAQHPESVPAPAWHGEELSERAAALERGDETVEDWETAKARIKKHTK